MFYFFMRPVTAFWLVTTSHILVVLTCPARKRRSLVPRAFVDNFRSIFALFRHLRVLSVGTVLLYLAFACSCAARFSVENKEHRGILEFGLISPAFHVVVVALPTVLCFTRLVCALYNQYSQGFFFLSFFFLGSSRLKVGQVEFFHRLYPLLDSSGFIFVCSTTWF